MAGKLTRKPAGQAAPSVDDFIAGAEQRMAVSSDMGSSHVISYDTKSYPWEDPKVREDVLKVYNLRLPEAYLMKLKYIAGNTPDSMQQFCLAALLPAIDAKIEELTGKR
jgi:hypothetical protein